MPATSPKRVLFVDDERNVLDGIRRSLRRRSTEWEMVFCDSPREALEEAERSSFDVVVSDMRMPGIDGAELLSRVKQIHPGSVRIILSGQTTEDAALRAVPVAHQFLAKPCGAQLLEATIERAYRLQSLLDSEKIQALVGGVDALPSPPASYHALKKALDQPDIPLGAVARIVEQDVAMSAKILQMVNSAFFRLPQPLTSVSRAVSYLGLGAIKGVALSLAVFGKLSTRVKPARFERARRHAVLTAGLARAVAQGKQNADDTFAAGLLHDVGQLVLDSTVEAYSTLDPDLEGHDRIVAERELLGATHAEVGAYLLGLWAVPFKIVDAVAHHHEADVIPGLAGTIQLAERLAHEASNRVEDPGIESIATTLGCDHRLVELRAAAVELRDRCAP